MPWRSGNDGKTLVLVDLAEINHKPMPTRSPSGHRAMDLKATLEALRADLAELEDENASLSVTAAGHRTDYERERDPRRHAHGRAAQIDGRPNGREGKFAGELAAAPATMVEAARQPRIPSPGKAVDAGAQAA